MAGSKVRLFQIFYDAKTEAQVSAPFEGLDNTSGPEGWFELFPILRYLETHDLDPETWYGFLSPKFTEKVGFTADDILGLIAERPDADVALFSSRWLYIVWFENVWQQGEQAHDGIIDCAETFFSTLGPKPDFRSEIDDLSCAVFSNNIVARPKFWREWQTLARAYYDYVENGCPESADNAETHYVGPSRYAMKTFVQERLACWALSRGDFKTIYPDHFSRRLPDTIDGEKLPVMRALLRMTHACKSAARRGIPLARPAYKLVREVAIRQNLKLKQRYISQVEREVGKLP